MPALQGDRARLFKGLAPVSYLAEYPARKGFADGLVLAQAVRALAILEAGDLRILYLAVTNSKRHLQLGPVSICV